MNQKYAVPLIAFILSSCNPFANAERKTAPADIAASGSAPVEALEGCLVTRPSQPAFIPQTGIAPGEDQFFYGSDSLWTTLPRTGVWNALPQSAEGFTQKIFWLSKDFDVSVEPNPSLAVTALLLDDKTPRR